MDYESLLEELLPETEMENRPDGLESLPVMPSFDLVSVDKSLLFFVFYEEA